MFAFSPMCSPACTGLSAIQKYNESCDPVYTVDITCAFTKVLIH